MSRNQSELHIPVGERDHRQGPSDAPVTLVEYGDYQCPYCGQAYFVLKKVLERLEGKVQFVFRNFPLVEAHPFAMAAAETAEAAGLQRKFWEMHDLLYEHQDALQAEDLARYATRIHLDAKLLSKAIGSGEAGRRVQSDFEGGVRSGVNGTPTFFVNGRKFDGDWTDERAFADALATAARNG